MGWTTAKRAYCLLFAAAAVSSGCAQRLPANMPINLRPTEGGRWISPDATDRYRCDTGIFVCDSPIGRLSTRLCECSQP
jgi:hypothetical protein